MQIIEIKNEMIKYNLSVIINMSLKAGFQIRNEFEKLKKKNFRMYSLFIK